MIYIWIISVTQCGSYNEVAIIIINKLYQLLKCCLGIKIVDVYAMGIPQSGWSECLIVHHMKILNYWMFSINHVLGIVWVAKYTISLDGRWNKSTLNATFRGEFVFFCKWPSNCRMCAGFWEFKRIDFSRHFFLFEKLANIFTFNDDSIQLLLQLIIVHWQSQLAFQHMRGVVLKTLSLFLCMHKHIQSGWELHFASHFHYSRHLKWRICTVRKWIEWVGNRMSLHVRLH